MFIFSRDTTDEKPSTLGSPELLPKLPQLPKLPDFGPVDIDDYTDFKKKSKEVFIKLWNSPYKENEFSLIDFEKLKLIGSGSFGNIYLVRNNKTKKLYAMKAILKKTVMFYHQLEHTKTEKLVLQSINSPFTLRLNYFFKDNSYIYFIIPFIQGGDLYTHLKKKGKFNEIETMFYSAQIILAVEYLHYLDIVYRDLKPENILMDHTGYLKLADFGFCKLLTNGRTYTLCGTPEYIAPEVLLSRGYGKSVDWWGIGILTYELSAGFSPFRETKPLKVYQKILTGSYRMAPHFSPDLKDLLRNILQADITRRYGNLKDGTDDFKRHKWFRPLNWQAVVQRKMPAPFLPKIKDPEDSQYLPRMKYESLIISSEEEYPEEFADF
uniref:cAMP-dependent protein kinase n=1 Tax=Cuerna arida TaxID=1464854 RepID=A0A1B6ET07_9HEMI